MSASTNVMDTSMNIDIYKNKATSTDVTEEDTRIIINTDTFQEP